MKILILGANGMLGYALKNELASRNDLTLGDKQEFDLTRPDYLRQKIEELDLEVVINAAGYTNVDGCETETQLCHQVNGQAVGDLAKICRELDLILVHYSTDYVFDGQNQKGYKEDDPLNPINAYGKSKALGEKLLQENCQKYYLIRTSFLYGDNGLNFVEKIIELSKIQDPLRVVNDQVSCPTYAKDLATATMEILEAKKPFGIYHVTNSGCCSKYEFALKIKEFLQFESEIETASSEEFPQPADRPSCSKLLNTKLDDLRPWDQALKDYLSKITI